VQIDDNPIGVSMGTGRQDLCGRWFQQPNRACGRHGRDGVSNAGKCGGGMSLFDNVTVPNCVIPLKVTRAIRTALPRAAAASSKR
jgi:hypothetical protein